ncbi:MAG: heme o synthase [Proteobacteria bacterium]|nr:heme o synthase [Pseudomonadota bacterium]
MSISSIRHFHTLTKPTISLLVVISALPGFLLPQSSLPDMWLLIVMVCGVYLCSASAAVFNQVLEWKIDSTMSRTARRSLPAGHMPRWQASLFAWLLGIGGLVVLWFYVSPLSALIGLIGHVYYVIFYTLILKKRTEMNIVIGGVAGAVGPLMGAAAAGSIWSFEAWLLFILIVLWTPPHFWSLSLKYQKDYARAGIPMYPVVYGESATRRMIFLYSLSLLPVVALLWVSGLLWASFFSCLLTLYFVYLGWKLYKDNNNKGAMRLFHFSCIYALLVFVLMATEKWWVLV